MNLAWEFREVLSGYFERDRAKMIGRKFPIIGPLPDRGPDTQPLKNKLSRGPYIYAVCSSGGEILYIGKADEKTVLYRWIRPDRRNKSKYYWAHGTTSPNPKKESTIEKISKLLETESGPITVQFANYKTLKSAVQERFETIGQDATVVENMKAMDFIKDLEHCMIFYLQPLWNTQGKKKQPTSIVSKHGEYWENEIP